LCGGKSSSPFRDDDTTRRRCADTDEEASPEPDRPEPQGGDAAPDADAVRRPAFASSIH